MLPGCSGACRVAPSEALRPEGAKTDVRFSNRPFGVKRFQTIHRFSVDAARGLVLLFGIGTKALPSWDSKMRLQASRDKERIS
jgi:hypothetical protein